MIFCLKIEEFLLFLTRCFKLTTNHERKFASTCKMCFPNTCKTVLCSGNQFPVKIHIFLFFNFVPLFMELPQSSMEVCTVKGRRQKRDCSIMGISTRNRGNVYWQCQLLDYNWSVQIHNSIHASTIITSHCTGTAVLK